MTCICRVDGVASWSIVLMAVPVVTLTIAAVVGAGALYVR